MIGATGRLPRSSSLNASSTGWSSSSVLVGALRGKRLSRGLILRSSAANENPEGYASICGACFDHRLLARTLEQGERIGELGVTHDRHACRHYLVLELHADRAACFHHDRAHFAAGLNATASGFDGSPEGKRNRLRTFDGIERLVIAVVRPEKHPEIGRRQLFRTGAQEPGFGVEELANCRVVDGALDQIAVCGRRIVARAAECASEAPEHCGKPTWTDTEAAHRGDERWPKREIDPRVAERNAKRCWDESDRSVEPLQHAEDPGPEQVRSDGEARAFEASCDAFASDIRRALEECHG